MTDLTFNLTFTVRDGDNLNIKKTGNYKKMLAEVPPMHGVFIATMLLAIDNILEHDDKLLDVIKLLCAPEEVERVEGALKALAMLVTLDKMKEETEQAEKADQN